MKEEIIISGRSLPHIDPYLDLWHWPISLYLFLGGLSAGILFFASLFTLLGKENQMEGAVKRAPLIVPVALSIGLLVLLYDLTHVFYAWKLFTTFKIMAPMSWGAWVLLSVTILSILWVIGYFNVFFPNWNYSTGWRKKLKWLMDWVNKQRRSIAWVMLLGAVLLGVYTGILLSAFNARPLWNTSVLGILFLISGLSTGAAAIIWSSKSEIEKLLMTKIDLGLIIAELFLIIHMVFGLYAGPQVQIIAVKALVEGPFKYPFFGGVILLGLLVPGILEILTLKRVNIPHIISVILILIGGLIFRFVMVDAGQFTGYLF